MLLPSGTHAAPDILIEGSPQECGKFCLVFIGIVAFIECAGSRDFLRGGRFLSKGKLFQFNIGQRNRVAAGLLCDARR